MSTATIAEIRAVNAPSKATTDTFLIALRNKATGLYARTTGWLGQAARKTGLSRVFSVARRYLAKAYSLASTVVRSAGVIPLSVLTLTTHTGQRIVRTAARAAWGLASWVGRKVFGIIDFTLSIFGRPGQTMARKFQETRSDFAEWAGHNLRKTIQVVRPFYNPDRLYMKGAKAVSYAMVAVGLIGTFVNGVWVIPAYLLAAGVGVLASPEVRTNLFVNRLFGAVQSKTRAQHREAILAEMDKMVQEHGPDMDTWTSALRSNHTLKGAMLKYLDNDPEYTKDLTSNQRRKMDKWIANFGKMEENNILIDPVTGEAVLEGEIVV